jgi:hypothetical protein
MFEERNPIYRFIFQNAHGWLGKLSACTIIGGIVFSLGGMEFERSGSTLHWATFGFLGGLLGLIAALILIVRDLVVGANIDDEMARPRRQLSPNVSATLIVASVLAGFAAIVFGLYLYIQYCATHSH